jgi:hypothetical protein
MTIEELEKKVAVLEARNKKVETNKAWETSFFRVLMLVAITYAVVGLTLIAMQNPQPWINALIPSLGFFLSTLSLPFIKKYWVKYIYKK